MAITRSLSQKPAGRPLAAVDAAQLLRFLRENDVPSWAELERLSGLAAERFAAARRFAKKQGVLEASKLPRINARAGHVLAMDIGGSRLRIALADLGGTVVAKWSASTRRTSSPAEVMKQIREGVAELLREASVKRSSLRAVAAGAPGATDADAGVVRATSYLKGWLNVPLRDLLEKALGIPAAVQNDVKVGAIGEKWLGAARGLKDFVFLGIGTGIAAGVYVNDQLVNGANWSAGEVGYMLVPGAPVPDVEEGMPGALESVIGGEGIHQDWLRVCNGGDARRRRLSATDIFALAGTGDKAAKEVLDRTARMLAYAVYNMSLVLNSPLFVLGGGVGSSPVLLEATERVLQRFAEPALPKLALSRLGQEAQLIGTIRLALDTAAAHLGEKA